MAAPGAIEIPTSLVTVICAVADFELSATLVAVTCTADGDGRSAGAEYTPSAEIVPSALVPPATPFTAQVTRVSVVLLTVALNACVAPSRIVPLAGVTLTTTEAGAGGGGAGGAAAEPPPQPEISARPTARARLAAEVVSVLAHRESRSVLEPYRERDRTPGE